MRFFTSSLLAIAALAGSVFAAENPISKPDGSVPLVAGETVTITWNPTTSGPITLKLRKGPSGDLKDVATVVGGYENSGSFTYTIPKNTPSGTDYAFQISDDKTTDVNYTPLLTITSDVAPSSSSSSSTASGSTSSSTGSSTTSSSSASGPTTTSKPETTSKHGHNNSTMLTSTTSASNGTTSTTYGSSNGTTTRNGGGSSGPKATSGSSGPSSTGSSSAPSTTAPSSGAVSLVMNSPLALVVCVLGAVMYLN